MKIIYTSFGTILAMVLALTFLGNSSGPASVNGSGYTGAPGESFTCGGCHNGGAFGEPVTTVVVSRLGTTVTEYVPNTTYDVVVTVTAPMGTPAAYGFQMVALNSGENSAGAFANPSSNMQFSVGNSGRTYAEHNMRSVSNVFSFEWTASGGLTGDVTIYAVGNAVNNAGGTNGDNGSNTATVVVLPEAALPIELFSFEGTKTGLQSQLDWEVAEEGIQNYVVERATDGLNFKEIGSVAAIGSESYSFVDERPFPGDNYYRLSINGVDGLHSYSPIVTVKMPKLGRDISVFPNPAIGTANLAFDLQEGDYNMTVYNSVGQMMESKAIPLGSGINSTSINTEAWSAGVYVVEMKSDAQVATTKFVKR